MSSSIIFSCIWLSLFKKYGLNTFQNGLELPSTLSFSKYCNLAYLFRFATRFRCHLNVTMSLGFLDLFELFLIRVLIITCSRRFLLKWCFNFSFEIVYMKRITQTSFKGICRHKWKFRICKSIVISKSMHESPSPLKRVFCFIIL